MTWKVSSKAIFVLNEEVFAFTMEEGGEWIYTRSFTDRLVRVRDIVFCKKTQNARQHTIWARVNALKALDCHSFMTFSKKRYDAVNDFKVY